MIGKANALAEEHKFFHWPLEFPDVFEQGGFDVVLGNPPWEKIKLQEQEFFETRDKSISNAKNKSERDRLINILKQNRSDLFQEFTDSLHNADSNSKFLRESGNFPLGAVGDINTYVIFTELATKLLNVNARAGLIIPTGIATDNTTKDFFSYLVDNDRLIQLIGFENEEFIFPNVHHAFKFCAITIAGTDQKNIKTKFTFYNRNFNSLLNDSRFFELSKDDFNLLNPNTKTCPVFRTKNDFTITKKIYTQFPILVNENIDNNSWNIGFSTMFHMSNDSGLFFNNFAPNSYPLYEAKMFFQYDHRYTSYENATEANIRQGTLPQLTTEEHSNPMKFIKPYYWVSDFDVNERLGFLNIESKYLLCFRGITSSNLERTFVSAILPKSAIGNSAPFFLTNRNAIEIGILNSIINNLISDFILRQKLSGNNLNLFLIKQIPFPTPTFFNKQHKTFLLPKILELIFTSWDIKTFADDIWRESDVNLRGAIQEQWDENLVATGGNKWEPPVWCEKDEAGCPLPPFKWHENRRATLKAEIDAFYAKLYGLTTEELKYILDPKDVYGEDFPGETFRVLKDKEIRNFGEYRTRRLVLEAWERLNNED